jgi:hypothetical protein
MVLNSSSPSEEQIQHDEKSDDKLECGLANVDGLGGKELAAFHKNLGQSFLHRGKVRQPETIEQSGHPCRQGVQDLLKITINSPEWNFSYKPDASWIRDAAISADGRITMATTIVTVTRAARLRRCRMDLDSRR